MYRFIPYMMYNVPGLTFMLTLEWSYWPITRQKLVDQWENEVNILVHNA